MLQINCPWCGARDERDFSYGGEVPVPRPDPAVSDAAWAEYLYYRDNLKGPCRERWRHSAGCGQWFIVLRHSVSHEIQAIERLDTGAPS